MREPSRGIGELFPRKNLGKTVLIGFPHSYSNFRICCSIIQVPIIFKLRQSFYKTYPVYLSGYFVGFIGLRNADSDTSRYGGRGLAIGGMVLGTITFLASLFALIAFVANANPL